MISAVKLTVVMTHPAQYYAPWFRYLAAHCPELELTVLYATQPTPEQQGVGFGRAFTWDVPLTEGYRNRVVRAARPTDDVHCDRFWGVDSPEIAAALAESAADVALINGWHSITQLRALWACRRQGIPALYRGDTNLNNAPNGWRKRAWWVKTALLLRLFDGYLSVGQRSREYLRHFGAPEQRIFHAPHCVDNQFFAGAAAQYQTPAARAEVRASFGLPADAFVILFAGKLEPKKRPLDLIRAAAVERKQARLLVAGSGALENACRVEAGQLGVDVAWAGFLNQQELGRAYAAADCLALPSDGETWGLVVNEALATGLPCVVSDRVGCAPDLVTPGVTGEVFPAGDVAALTEALGRVRERRHQPGTGAAACRARAEKHSFEAATRGLLTACKAMVNGRK